ncbi:hypothetical protein OSB04_027207 [Centaurea solstitialis]|uniref:Leucine-rich repeat-containing N-terminal plant-type domain-containing protein n=1 Tax=Centaurea solstitialis TaxID=347529 RepID=A0AA38SQE7_9ASTR|nr:hypothetical protein OSB04_027207 [Centaurea solstitialis]
MAIEVLGGSTIVDALIRASTIEVLLGVSTRTFTVGQRLGSDYYPVMMNWRTSTDCCEWDGVSCDPFTGDVIALDLSCGMLRGQVPMDITILRKLVSLDLSANDLKLEPHVFYNLLNNCTTLEKLLLGDVNISATLPAYANISFSLISLDLSFTGLQGKLPDYIFNLPYLEQLDLSSNNQLYGEIPYSIGHLNSLNTLRLNSCGLTGPLPKSIVNLRHLKTLDLASNMFNETLPSLLFTLPTFDFISLKHNMFSGRLPSELFTQRSLKQLYLGHNQFDGMIEVLDQGSIPQTFQQLLNLTALDLSNNKFSGVWELDTLLSSLRTLETLHLSYSGLSVTTNNVSRHVNSNLQSLDLASCKIKVFPESLRGMRKLAYLDLSRNEIDGHIGGIGGNKLVYLDLSHNNITGPFPSSIWSMGNLGYLNLSNNHFNGVIKRRDTNFPFLVIDVGNNNFSGTIPHVCGEVPSCFSKCRGLEVLDLGNNRLNGPFPGQLGRLPNLKVLILKSNKLNGPIKSSSTIEHPFPSMRVLDLSQNEFGGHLPKKYFQNFDAMKNVVKDGTNRYLKLYSNYKIIVVVKGQQHSFEKVSDDYTIVDLSGNKIEGEIPNEICSLNSLIVLNLSNNNLNGQIPHAIGNLSEIESLDLSGNQLTGKIPQSLADITYLAVINLSQNHLVGRIPSGRQFNTFNDTSFEGNPGLCGFPLPNHCEHPSTPPQLDTDEDEESGFTWEVVMLGFGCGTLLGLVIGYLMLSTGRPKWFNTIADEIEHMVQRRQNKRRHIIYIGK